MHWLTKEIVTWYEWNPFLNNEERSVKALEDINRNLDRHQNSLENSWIQNMSSSSYREPQYIPPPEVYIDTDSLADAQYEISDRLGWVLDAQRDLVRASNRNNSLQKKLVSNQWVTNSLLDNLTRVWNQHAVNAYRQREEQLSELMNITNWVWWVTRSVDKTRKVMQTLLTDIGWAITNLTNEQIITRMWVIQALSKVETTFLQSHENEMLSHQRTQNLLQEILMRSGQTEQEKYARQLWEKAEFLRYQWNFEQALAELKKAYELDDMNPQILLSSAIIQSSIWNFSEASNLFLQTEQIAEFKWPHMNSYILMNMASNLVELKRYNHAERVMYKAVRKDPLNREAWFKYAITAWKTPDKKNNALICLKQLLQLNPVYYKAQIVINPDLEDLRNLLKGF